MPFFFNKTRDGKTSNDRRHKCCNKVEDFWRKQKNIEKKISYIIFFQQKLCFNFIANIVSKDHK